MEVVFFISLPVHGSIRRRITRFISLIFVPLVLRILQNRELIRRQQRLDFSDGSHSVWLETGPDSLQLVGRCLNLGRVLRCARPAVRLLSGMNPGLVGCLILPARVGEGGLDGLPVWLCAVAPVP